MCCRNMLNYFCWKEIFSLLEKVSGIPLDTDADLDVQTLIGFQDLLHMPGIWKDVCFFLKSSDILWCSTVYQESYKIAVGPP